MQLAKLQNKALFFYFFDKKLIIVYLCFQKDNPYINNENKPNIIDYLYQIIEF